MDFDERAVRKVYPQWQPKPGSKVLDTLIIARLLYPQVIKSGPNNHKLPPQLRGRHSLKAWGMRLGVHKADDFDGGDWQTWTPQMQSYMDADIPPLVRLFKWLMSQKPSMQAVELEHDFQRIINRQEAWGFTFDMDKALKLASELQDLSTKLELELCEMYGEWWEPGKTKTTTVSRKVKMVDHPDITRPRFNSAGKRLPKDYIGPPLCEYDQGSQFTPITRVAFNPASRDHVRMILERDHGWKPQKFTDKGTPQVDDEVLRALPWPSAQKLADFYMVQKLLGFVNSGKNAWLKTAVKEGSEYRQHGRHQCIGTYTFRGAHSNPNMGQIPARDPVWGHRCRELFIPRAGFVQVGFDGSGIQLRGLAHYMAKYDGGKMVAVFERGEDPHEFMRDTVGTDLMGEGDEGRKRGKTTNYALCFGGGDWRLGQIVRPLASESEQRRVGKIVRTRLADRLEGLPKLRQDLEDIISDRGYILGLDGRKAQLKQGRMGLSTLLQMFEAVVMKTAHVILDNDLKAAGLRCGVDEAGRAWPDLADYEYDATVHDEVQADVRPKHVDLYRSLALQCVTKAGILLRVKCPLASDVKVGQSWKDTH